MISADQIAIAPDHRFAMIVIPIVHVRAHHGERVLAMREPPAVSTMVIIGHMTAALSHGVTRITHLPRRMNTIPGGQKPSAPWNLVKQLSMHLVAPQKGQGQGSQQVQRAYKLRHPA
jgi:hypothetical protein